LTYGQAGHRSAAFLADPSPSSIFHRRSHLLGDIGNGTGRQAFAPGSRLLQAAGCVHYAGMMFFDAKINSSISTSPWNSRFSGRQGAAGNYPAGIRKSVRQPGLARACGTGFISIPGGG